MTKTRPQSQTARLAELELTCRIWMAAAAAKDRRIEELEKEVDKLRHRATRLGQMLGSGQGRRIRIRARCGR